MGYRIEYQPIRKVRGVEKRTSRIAALTGSFFLGFLLLVNSVWSEGAEVMRGLLFSGDGAVTASAMEDFAIQLKAGKAFSNALETLCRTLMEQPAFGQS